MSPQRLDQIFVAVAVTAVGALLAIACVPATPPGVTRAAITNATPDSGDPAVVAIVNADGTTVCSGSLIGPHTVLTAAHCQIDPLTYGSYQVFFGASLAEDGTFADIADARVHPGFIAATWANDLAVLTIRQAVAAAPLPLDGRTLDASLVGQTFQAVGFGVTGATTDSSGQKRTGTAQVSAVGDLDFTSVPDPSLACTADSGGPALFVVDGATVITGVVSHGDAACTDHTTYARVDVGQAAFIQPYLAATAPGTAGVGDPCFYDGHCGSGPCLPAADEPRLYFCSQPCHARGDCPAAMICAPDGCRYPTPSPGATGWACAADADCLDHTCLIPTGAAKGICTHHCGDVGQDCPAGFVCENSGGGIDFYCRRAPSSSGCSARAAAGGGVAGPALLLLGLGAGGRRRRRRS